MFFCQENVSIGDTWIVTSKGAERMSYPVIVVNVAITAALAAGLIALCVHGARVAKREAAAPRNPLPMVELGGISDAAKKPMVAAVHLGPASRALRAVHLARLG
jgi:hypothetical protein